MHTFHSFDRHSNITGTEKTNASFCMRKSNEYRKKLSTKSRIAIRRCIYSSEADWRRHPPNECRQQQCWSGSGGGNSNTSAAMLVAIHVCSQFCFNRCFAWVDNKFVLRPHQLKSASDGIDRTSI